MSYLLDTHVVLWWLTDPKNIRPKSRNIITDAASHVFISSVSFWEMAIKQSLHRLTIPHNLLETLISEGFKILPILPEEALGVADLPLIHTDPFDRLLIAQAKLNDFAMITRDKQIAKYPVTTLPA